MAMAAVRVLQGADAANARFADLLSAGQPVILRGRACDWPLVVAAQNGMHAAMDYLRGFDSGQPITAYEGTPEIAGRFFYTPGMDGLNFAASNIPLSQFFEKIVAATGAENQPSHYIGSTDLDAYFPGLDTANHLALDEAMFAENRITKSIWLGNRTTAAAHYDMSHNIACCIAGHRRFTLFPPDQIANLYPGPLEPTPGGQVVSMVNIAHPDHAVYPRFRDAQAVAQIADLEPGDVLFYPAMWWHNVDAQDDFNILINYWWNTSPAYMDAPMTTLLHALLSLRGRPQQERQAWQHLFEYYVFGDTDAAINHLPAHIQGDLAPLDDLAARRLRAKIVQKVNR